MKLLCVVCDEVMDLVERQLPGDGTLAAVFVCATCSQEVALLTNPQETQLVSGLGVRIGGRVVREQPMELVRSSLKDGREGTFVQAEPDAEPKQEGASPTEDGPSRPAAVTWSPEAQVRLERVPDFVRGMVERMYLDYAREHGISELTPAIMDRARAALGIEGM